MSCLGMFCSVSSKVADALMCFLKQTIPQAQSLSNALSSVPCSQIKQEARLYGEIEKWPSKISIGCAQILENSGQVTLL